MPDVIEMPYRPPLKNSGLPEEKAYTYASAMIKKLEEEHGNWRLLF